MLLLRRAMRVALACLLLLAFLVPISGLEIIPDKQLVSPGKNYIFKVEGTEEKIDVILINNATRTKANWKVDVEGNTVIVTVPKDAKFAEYLLEVRAAERSAEAQILVKPPLTVMLAVFAVPVFLSIGMVGGGIYAFAKKKGVLRYFGAGLATFGSLILFWCRDGDSVGSGGVVYEGSSCVESIEKLRWKACIEKRKL